MDSSQFIELFIGHFIGAGMLEELFKAGPVILLLILTPNLSNLNLPGIRGNKLSPTIAILVGASSAVGFMIEETLGQYVPDVDEPLKLAYGLMLLIPRFITGMAGHAGWSGIFAYYIALGFYYNRVNIIYPIAGWILASALHGLWNSTSAFSPIFGSLVALSTFVIFIVYLFKSKLSFPAGDTV